MSIDKTEKDVSIQRKFISSILRLAVIARIFHKRQPPVDPRKILVMQWAYLGDIILSTPALKILRDAYPLAQIYLLTNPETKSYINDFPFVDEVIYLRNPLQLGRRRFAIGDFFKCISRLREEKFDLVVELTGRLTSQAFLIFLKAGYFVGQDPTNDFLFLNKKVNSGRKHEIYRNIDVIDACTDQKSKNVSVAIWNPVTNNDREDARKLFEGYGGNEYIIVHPIGSWSPRQWPVERWAQVVDYLLAKGKKIIFIGSEQDRSGIESIRERLNGRDSLNLAGVLTIHQAMALMEKARFFLGIDSGPMHLAAAVNLKGVVLFSAGDPLKWRHSIHAIIYKNPECGPCPQFAFSKVCRKGRGICVGLDEISAEDVIAACEKYL